MVISAVVAGRFMWDPPSKRWDNNVAPSYLVPGVADELQQISLVEGVERHF
jgi:hypothetical protein